MNIVVQRYGKGEDSSGGTLHIDGKFCAYTCEDEQRQVKVSGETRIPAGKYRVALRNEGGMTVRYGQRFPFHKGMIWLKDVPGFEWVYIHVGNNDDDTEGCVLVGDGAQCIGGEFYVTSSVDAYTRIYPFIADAIINGEEVWCEVRDELV